MKKRNSFNREAFDSMPVIGILRGMDKVVMDKVVPLYSKVGFTTLEVTMNSEGVKETISRLVEEHPELNIGAGTVCTVDELEVALSVGASYIVTPILNKEVIQICVKADIPVFPGAYSPSEIFEAWQLGASAVKVFPASQLGPQYIKEVLAPLNGIKLLPTGGVNIHNIEAFFNAGAIGVGMGSTLFDKQMIADGDFEALAKHFKSLKARIESCK